MKRAKVSPKNFFSQRVVIQIEFADIGSDRLVTRSHLLKPGAVMTPQGFTHGKPRQARAITLFGIPLVAQLVKLELGDGGEPATKAVTILVGAELDNVGNAVIIGVKQWTGWI
jgi:hypothetical protein